MLLFSTDNRLQMAYFSPLLSLSAQTIVPEIMTLTDVAVLLPGNQR